MSGALLATVVVPGAASEAGDAPPEDGEVTPGLLGLLVFVALFAATFLLWRSMRGHLRKIDFEEREDPENPEGQEDPGESDQSSAAESRDDPPRS